MQSKNRGLIKTQRPYSVQRIGGVCVWVYWTCAAVAAMEKDVFCLSRKEYNTYFCLVKGILPTFLYIFSTFFHVFVVK